MQVKVRLFFHLRRFGPAGEGDFLLELPPGARVGQALQALAIPALPPKVTLVNGRQAALDHDLKQDDLLVVFPPVEGG